MPEPFTIKRAGGSAKTFVRGVGTLLLIGVAGITTGAGSSPPSLPIWIQGGPAVRGSGAPPALPSAAHMVCGAGMPGCGP